MDMLINGEAQNVTDLSKQLGRNNGYITRLLSLNSLAPDIVEAILAGTEPEGLSIAKLTEQPIPEDRNEQRRLYGFPERWACHRLLAFPDEFQPKSGEHFCRKLHFCSILGLFIFSKNCRDKYTVTADNTPNRR